MVNFIWSVWPSFYLFIYFIIIFFYANGKYSLTVKRKVTNDPTNKHYNIIGDKANKNQKNMHRTQTT